MSEHGRRSARDRRYEWLESRDSNIAGHDDDRGGYYYVEQELIVVAEDFPRLERALEPLDIAARREDDDHDLGVFRVRLEFGGGGSIIPVPDVLARIRGAESASGERPLRAGPNHVMAGEPEYDGGPAGPAYPTDRKLHVGGGPGKGVRVAVIDTGYTRGVHPVMDEHVTSTGTPELDAQPKDGQIDYEAGHGTFVAGLILHRAPQAHVAVAEVLGPAGFATEHDIARAVIRHGGADVINLSLGGYTDGDRAPWSLNEALKRVRPETAIVAAAGNNASSRPMWPAAFKRVLGVGAVDPNGRRAEFSNFGWWVDACAPAVDVVGAFPRYPAQTNEDATEPFFDGWAIWSGTSFAAPKLAGEIAARLSAGRYSDARDVAWSLVHDPTRPHVDELGTLLIL